MKPFQLMAQTVQQAMMALPQAVRKSEHGIQTEKGRPRPKGGPVSAECLGQTVFNRRLIGMI